MSSVCPAGHTSSADDYCDVCGLPIGAPPAAPAAAASGAEPAASAAEPAGTGDSGSEAGPCPNCHAPTPANALFCEACGYDFTTGSLPRPVTPPPPGPPGSVPDDAPTAETPTVTPAAPVAPVAPVAPPLAAGWVAEVWIDPDWYADQQSTDPMPSAGLPTVVPLRSQSLLVGRASASRGIHPDIDLGSDTGISRRHCQLTSDGRRWWVEDLGSSNGTYVGDATGPLPTTPLVQGQKRELDGDDRIYLGAWTRLVVRRAEPGEG
ncbi:FHA domain-containing protein [Nocardioides montaniterrae]